MENLVDVIEEAIKANAFPGETESEKIYRFVKPYIVSREEFEELRQEVNNIECDQPLDEDDVSDIVYDLIRQEIDVPQLNSMYNEMKKMHQKWIDG